MRWYYDLPVLSLGDHHNQVIKLKRQLRLTLTAAGELGMSSDIRLNRDYDSATQVGVSYVNQREGVDSDSVVPATWLALGFKEHNLLHFPGYVLRGVPWSPGVVKLDGAWVPLHAARALVTLRASGRWTGKVISGWRPDWYQVLVWNLAVQQHGSEDAASQYVARPGKSAHRFKDKRCPVDVTRAEQVVRANPSFHFPYSYLPNHIQFRYPGEVSEFTSEQLEASDPPTEDNIRQAIAYIESVEAGIK